MFDKGTEWIRADFHLHTKADKEFVYSGEHDRFISDYVDKLKDENIKLGAITNHNKFDLLEYRALKKKARKEDITILPGVELSVKEGANGIHCLIIFKDEDWVNGKSEYINQFLDEVFKGIDNRENENTRCNSDLAGTVECLNSYKKDYFILMAHIEQKNGFYKECEGGLIKSLSYKPWFKEKVLGFQKGRTRDKMAQLEEWMSYRIAYIEGSDCKSISEIGTGNKSFVKIGNGRFNSVVLSLKDFDNRVSLTPQKINHGYIKSIEFKGGKISDQKLNFSHELNSLIGIRGSGKSGIIEIIRYALDITPSMDEVYKNEVVKYILESGGQIILKLQDDHEKEYKITKILGESPKVLDEDDQMVGAKINSLLKNPLYFGQKDLSTIENGFELELLNKIVGKKTEESKAKLKDINNSLVTKISELITLDDQVNSIGELNRNLDDIQHKITIFEEYGLSEKLSKQVNLKKDKETITNIKNTVSRFVEEIENLVKSPELEELNNLSELESKEVPELFDKLSKEVNKVISKKGEIEKIKTEVDQSFRNVETQLTDIQGIMTSYEEYFAEIKRDINIPNVDPDDFSELKVSEEKVKKSIEQATKQEGRKSEIGSKIRELAEERRQSLIDEYDVYKEEIEKINENQKSLHLDIEFRGNKEYFLNRLKEVFKGTGINQTDYNKISEHFSDFVSIIIDVLLDDSKEVSEFLTENQLIKLKERIRENFADYIEIVTPNQIDINYHGRSIEKHSIGQRASALVLFILSQEENNLIMIDQPEDDLDNQVIYNEIIKEIKYRKPSVQFIFATHNANIPVLGDSEQVVAVSYNETYIDVVQGSIDNKEIQDKIVNIMEGGKEAFNKRTQIYNLWKK